MVVEVPTIVDQYRSSIGIEDRPQLNVVLVEKPLLLELGVLDDLDYVLGRQRWKHRPQTPGLPEVDDVDTYSGV